MLHHELKEQFIGYIRILNGKVWKTFAICIWVCIIWVVWKRINKLIFENVEFNTIHFVDEIKSRLWS